jgi:hypothetical protein
VVKDVSNLKKKKMKAIITLDQFAKQVTRNMDGIKVNSAFKARYGSISILEAYNIRLQELSVIYGYFSKIEEFEKFLINSNVNVVNSNVSESRYYFYNGIKYRFSNHVYPTGSMTSDFCVDLCADPHLIENVTF